MEAAHEEPYEDEDFDVNNPDDMGESDGDIMDSGGDEVS